MDPNGSPPTSPPETPSIGELCVAGDWACTRADLGALEHIAQRLATRVAEPVRREIEDLAQLCRTDPGRAFEAWILVKEHVWG